MNINITPNVTAISSKISIGLKNQKKNELILPQGYIFYRCAIKIFMLTQNLKYQAAIRFIWQGAGG